MVAALPRWAKTLKEINMSDPINRRHFLAAGAASGLALAETASDQQAQQQNQSPGERLQVGLMGAGGRGTEVAQGYARLTGVDVSFICDVDQRAADRVAGLVAKIGNRPPRVVTDFRRILDDKSVDILVITA